MGQTVGVPHRPERAPQRQLERAEAETSHWSTKSIACLLACLCYIFNGLYDVLTGELGTIHPVLFSAMRDTLALPVLLLLAGAIDFRDSRGLPRIPSTADLPAFALLGFIMWSYSMLNLLGLQLTSSVIASTMQQTVPAVSLTLSILMGEEPIPSLQTRDGLPKVIGTAASTIGALGLAFSGSSSNDAASSVSQARSMVLHFLGVLCLIGNVVAVSAFFVLQSRLIFTSPAPQKHQTELRLFERGMLRRWSTTPLAIAAWSMAKSCILSQLALLFTIIAEGVMGGRDEVQNVLAMPPHALIPVVYAAFVPASCGYALLTFANKHLAASNTLAVMPIQVLTSTVVAAAAFRTQITADQIGCMCLVVLGIVSLFLARRQRYEESYEQLDAEGDESVSVRSLPEREST